jgi:putative phosphoesterase
VIMHGHTHQAAVHRQNKTLIVNPGEVCGYLSGKATIGFLDTETMKVKLVPI